MVVATVANYVNAYKLLSEIERLTISEALVKASTSAERYDVVEAMAEAQGWQKILIIAPSTPCSPSDSIWPDPIGSGLSPQYLAILRLTSTFGRKKMDREPGCPG